MQRQIDSGERGVVGVNRHTGGPPARIPTLRIDDRPERAQVAATAELRARRDTAAVGQALAQIRRAAEGDANLMDAVIEAARRDATLGEICRVFRDVFGEYRDPAEV
jgi:methylmalonyl-CoA mutase N-terminal domain/subunit